ncbi:MAG: glycosyltransferase [Wigglesworthia glossinidia]|nr:glycosyltransferase [Wigglesworthia glossinidia]
MYFLQPILFLNFLFRILKNNMYLKNWKERYGFLKFSIFKKCILIHCVSLGEVKAIIPLIKIIQKKYKYIPILLTSTTLTGLNQIKKEFSESLYYAYFPYDLLIIIKKFLKKINLRLVIIVEKEIWPNFIKELHLRKIPIIIANARLSDKSFKRYKKIKFFIKNILNYINIIASQSIDDSNRFLALGLKKEKLKTIGNVKFDINYSCIVKKKQNYINFNNNHKRLVWIAASTHPGEEKIILKLHLNLLKKFPNLILILAPRHPERFKKVSQMIKNFKFNCINYTNKNSISESTHVILYDDIGRLECFYKISDIAFIGGSFFNYGGHNPLEAAINKLPILMGPFFKNFHDINIKLKQNNALIIVENYEIFIMWMQILLFNKSLRIAYGLRALKVFYKYQGATKNLFYLIKDFLDKK